MGEFELIDRFFKRNKPLAGARQAQAAIQSEAPGVLLGIGDDCALLQPAPGQQLAVSTDMLVEGRHFFADVDPAALGHKALAVNLSDLAAMGAEPLAFTLALALPPARAADQAWLAALASGLFALADASACPLVGGDTTAGPLNLCLTVFGQVPPGQALRRSDAQPGDDVWVSGTLGDARLALGALRGEWALPPAVLAAARQRLERPTPRLALGRALRGVAHAAADVSDGLVGDLGHILAASGVGAVIEAQLAPSLIASSAMWTLAQGRFSSEKLTELVLAGGDDYELVFTAPASARAAVLAAGQASATPVTRLGRTVAGHGLAVVDAAGRPLPGTFRAFDHFG